ncbi:MbtH family protein [Streptomyces monticola]|uniref:MbtH family protein n=1 Tax=Streptomyces monticola TaxID=2666263 RepID=A0ABW2JRQ3_9ACTN
MPNPFEDEAGDFLVLINDELQHSLWPRQLPVPDGWRVGYGPEGRAECLRYVERSWTDMRPASLQRVQQ